MKNNARSLTGFHRALGLVVAAGALWAAVAFVGCDGTVGTVSYATTDPYLYDGYYTADVGVSSAYWVNPWNYTVLYAYPVPVATSGADGGSVTVVATGGTSGTTGVSTSIVTAGDVIRALARGESICPSQVTITPKLTATPCSGADATERTGVTLVFNGCQTPGGGTLDGTVDVSSTHMASSAACDSSTSITLTETTTITSLSYTGPSGARLVIPSETDTGTVTFTFGGDPPTVPLSSTGELQLYRADGTLASDHSFTGMRTFTFGGSSSGYTIDGNLVLLDKTTNVTTTLTMTGLERVSTCCRPVGGTLQIAQPAGAQPGSHTWTFGPACDATTIDGTSATLPSCI